MAHNNSKRNMNHHSSPDRSGSANMIGGINTNIVENEQQKHGNSRTNSFGNNTCRRDTSRHHDAESESLCDLGVA